MLPAWRTWTHWTRGSDDPASQANRAVPTVLPSEKLEDSLDLDHGHLPARFSARALTAARARQDGLALQPWISPITAALSPRASAFARLRERGVLCPADAEGPREQAADDQEDDDAERR